MWPAPYQSTVSPSEMSEYFLTSGRLGFRHWRQADEPLALALWTDPMVTRFIATRPLAGHEALLRLNREIDTQASHGIQYWPMFLLEGDVFVGCCGLRPREREPDVPEFGVHLRPDHWGRGLAAEGARAVFSHAFESLGCRALFAGHNPGNDASRKLLTKLGFTHTHDEFYPPTGLMHPSYRLVQVGMGIPDVA